MIQIENLSKGISYFRSRNNCVESCKHRGERRRVCSYYGTIRLWKIHVVEYPWSLDNPTGGSYKLLGNRSSQSKEKNAPVCVKV